MNGIALMHDKLTPERIRLNYQDYCALPADGKRYEILDGELHVSPSPKTEHQRAVLNLGSMLSRFVDARDLGEVFVAPFDVLLTETDIVQPDIIFVARENSSIITPDNIRGVPNLLVEVLSQAHPELDTRDKRQVYARCGVPFYWLADPWHKTLTELQLLEQNYATVTQCRAGDTFTPQLFADLTMDADGLWTPRR
ncbi:MAG: Uma2 family endonuclease [Planctomycetota bacterium]